LFTTRILFYYEILSVFDVIFYSARVCKTQQGVTDQNKGKYLTDQSMLLVGWFDGVERHLLAADSI